MNDLVWWEAVYENGSSIVSNPAKYRDIDRDRIQSFRVKDRNGIVFAMDRPADASGESFIYRRRHELASGSHELWFIVGFIGHIVAAYNYGTGQWVSHHRFIEGHPILYPPVPHPNEGETFSPEDIV